MLYQEYRTTLKDREKITKRAPILVYVKVVGEIEVLGNKKLKTCYLTDHPDSKIVKNNLFQTTNYIGYRDNSIESYF